MLPDHTSSLPVCSGVCVVQCFQTTRVHSLSVVKFVLFNASRPHEFIPCLQWSLCCSTSSLSVVEFVLLHEFTPFSQWSLCCSTSSLPVCSGVCVAPRIHSLFLVKFVWLNLYFYVLTIICLFLLFKLAIRLSVLRFTAYEFCSFPINP